MEQPIVQHRGRLATALSILVLLLAWVWTFQGFSAHDPSAWVPRYVSQELGPEATLDSPFLDTDQGFVAWILSRNARTWTQSPSRLFEGEICYPAQQVLALGEPVLTLGLLAIPAWWATEDPLWTYNSVILLLPLLSALALFFVVRSWTGNPMAGAIAGLLYGFHSARLSDPTHLYVPDTVWTLLALFAFRRWLTQGSWRDVVTLGLCISLQVGGSLYPLLAGAAVGLPFAIWGLATIGVGHTRVLQWCALMGVLGVVLYAAFSPALSLATSGALAPRDFQVFLSWSGLLDDPERRLGLWLLLLPVLAFLPDRKLGPMSLRWALLAGAGLALWLASGGNVAARHLALEAGEIPPAAWPNLYAALSAVLPGLEVVRLPASIAYGAFLALALLAGFGAAALLERFPPRIQGIAAATLLALVFLTTIRPGWAGSPVFGFRHLEPAASEIDFYVTLEEKGDTGPILELPMEPSAWSRDGDSILVAAYHKRPTSACYNSFLPPASKRLQALTRQVPRPRALRALANLGFRTIVIHHNVFGQSQEEWLSRLQLAAERPQSPLQPLYSDGERTAFRIRTSHRSALPGRTPH